MMNKLVTAAVAGGAALACGVLAAVPAAAAAAPTPIPAPTSVAAPPTTTTPHAPGHRAPSHRAPSHHRTPGTTTPGNSHTGHRAHRTPGGTSGGHRAPSGHRTGRHTTHRPVAHRPVTPTPAPTTRIVGGRPVTNAPWAVQVNWDDAGFECSGTVVAPQWVLTAKHCVNPAGMTVLIGSTRLGDGTKVKVDDKIVAPAADLALLHLTEPVRTTYVALADEDPEVGAINEIYGWGKTDPSSGPSDVLKEARVRVTSVDCADAEQGKAICSTSINGMAYNGDSGGPEMAAGVEVGVCSTGNDEARTQQYTSVAANRDWIRQIANV